MRIENNTLISIDKNDIIKGVFTAPDEVTKIGNGFKCNDVLAINLPNVIEIGDYFLFENKTIQVLRMPKVEKIGNYFLFTNNSIKDVIMPSIKEIGSDFMKGNKTLNKINTPNIEKIDSGFLYWNNSFDYSIEILNALIDDIYIGGICYDKKETIRKFKLTKLINDSRE